MKKLPPLERETFEQIVYEMEDQDAEVFFHPGEMQIFFYDAGINDFSVMPVDEDHFEEFCAEGFPLPEWTSRDGFSTMEDFARALKKPDERDRLLRALEGGRGVFRRFKDTLDEFPDEVRSSWFAFKERRMGERVKDWYEELGGELAFRDLEEAGDEISEDLIETVLTNFSVSDSSEKYKEWIESIDEEMLFGMSPALKSLALAVRAGFTKDDSVGLVALDPEDRPVGYIRGGLRDSECLVLQFFVLENFRQAGLGELLLAELEKRISKKGGGEMVLTIPSFASFLSEAREKKGAVCEASVYVWKM